jgi:hypothetical protein
VQKLFARLKVLSCTQFEFLVLTTERHRLHDMVTSSLHVGSWCCKCLKSGSGIQQECNCQGRYI